MEGSKVPRDAPPPVIGEDGELLVALLKSAGLGGGEVAHAGALINGTPEAEVGHAEVGHAEDDAPQLLLGEYFVALLKSAGLGGGEVAHAGALINGAPEAEVGHAEDDAPQLLLGEYFVALLKSAGLGGGEVAHAGALINGAPEAEDDAPQLLLGEYFVALLKSASLGGGEVAHAGALINGATEAEVGHAEDDGPQLLLGENLVALLNSDVFDDVPEDGVLDDAPEDEDDQAQQRRGWIRGGCVVLLRAAYRLVCSLAREPVLRHVAAFVPGSDELVGVLAAAAFLIPHIAQGVFAHQEPVLRGWVQGASTIVLRAASAASRLLGSIAREPVILHVATFLPGSVELIVAIAAAAFLIAAFLIAHLVHGVLAHQGPPPRGWVHGARLLLPIAPAAAYLAVATFAGNASSVLIGDLANAVASLVFAVAVVAFAFLRRA